MVVCNNCQLLYPKAVTTDIAAIGKTQHANIFLISIATIASYVISI